MQLFIASREPKLIQQVEEYAAGIFDDCESLASFPDFFEQNGMASLAVVVDASSLVVIPSEPVSRGVSPQVAWLLGLCFAAGTPVVGLSAHPLTYPEKSFPPWRDVVTIARSMRDLPLVLTALGDAMSRGMEAYVEVATELHTKFLGE